MSDFFTVIVSNDDFVSLGMSTPHEVNPVITAVKPTAHVITFFFMLLYN